MRKKTAPRPRKHRQASPVQQPGLIVQGKNALQSATGRSALEIALIERLGLQLRSV